jgi:hypothetical protein
MSEGIRSGVNWMRLASRPSTIPSASTSLPWRARHADQHAVAAAEHGDERLFHHLVLAEDYRPDCGLGRGDMRGGRFRRPDDHVLELFDPVSACCRHHALLNSW